jgi:hypothetical protein
MPKIVHTLHTLHQADPVFLGHTSRSRELQAGESAQRHGPCKHTQSGGNCNRLAIEQVLRSITAYADIIRGEALPMVVTNSVGFTKDAIELAAQKGVWLISRDGLLELRKFRPKASG